MHLSLTELTETQSLSAAPFPVIDGHVDLLYRMMQRWPGRAFSEVMDDHVTSQGLREGNVRVLVSAFYCEDAWNGPGKAQARLNELLRYRERYLSGIPRDPDRSGPRGCLSRCERPGLPVPAGERRCPG